MITYIAISSHFVVLGPVCYWEKKISKQIEKFRLMVLLSILLNILPCFTSRSPFGLSRQPSVSSGQQQNTMVSAENLQISLDF